MGTNGYDLAHPAELDGETSYTFTCGKIDAGIAVLIGSHAHLIEFPSLLLPPGCEPGSIVSITCSRNQHAEKTQAAAFWDLQSQILKQFGTQTPQAPVLKLRSTTQTSVALEWDKLELAQSKLLSLSIWKNGQRLGPIPNPMNNFSTKLSGLDLDTEYAFHLVMRTTGGTYNSKQIKVRTHSLNDTTGINVCFGVVLPDELLEESKDALEDLGGRWTDKIQIDTTHFVCTMPFHPQQTNPNNTNSFPSLEYQRALQLSIPIVQPTWLLACLAESKMVPISAHYIGANPTTSYTGSTSSLARTRTGSKAGLSKTDSTISTTSEGEPKELAFASNSSPEPMKANGALPQSTIETTLETITASPSTYGSSPSQQPSSSPTNNVSSQEHSTSGPVSPKNTAPISPQPVDRSVVHTPPNLDLTPRPGPQSLPEQSHASSSQHALHIANDDPFASRSPSIYNPSPVRPLTNFPVESTSPDTAESILTSENTQLESASSSELHSNSIPVPDTSESSLPQPSSNLTPEHDPTSDHGPPSETESDPVTPSFLSPEDPEPDPNTQPNKPKAKEEDEEENRGGGEIADLWMGSFSPVANEAS